MSVSFRTGTAALSGLETLTTGVVPPVTGMVTRKKSLLYWTSALSPLGAIRMRSTGKPVRVGSRSFWSGIGRSVSGSPSSPARARAARAVRVNGSGPSARRCSFTSVPSHFIETSPSLKS